MDYRESYKIIDDQIALCAKNFAFVDRVVNEAKQPCYLYEDFRYGNVPPTPGHDGRLVRTITQLLERALLFLECAPPVLTLTTLQTSVKNLLAKSNTLTEEETLIGGYLNECLFPTLFERAGSLRLRSCHESLLDSPLAKPAGTGVDTLLAKDAARLTAAEVDRLIVARDLLYIRRRAVLSLAQFINLDISVIVLEGQLKKKGLVMEMVPAGEQDFEIMAGYDHLMDASAIAIRLKIERIFQRFSRNHLESRECNRMIRHMIEEKRKDASKSDFIDVSFGEIGLQELSEQIKHALHETSEYFRGPFAHALSMSPPGDRFFVHVVGAQGKEASINAYLALTTKFFSTVMQELYVGKKWDRMFAVIDFKDQQAGLIHALAKELIAHEMREEASGCAIYQRIYEQLTGWLAHGRSGATKTRRERVRAIRWTTSDGRLRSWEELTPEHYRALGTALEHSLTFAKSAFLEKVSAIEAVVRDEVHKTPKKKSRKKKQATVTSVQEKVDQACAPLVYHDRVRRWWSAPGSPTDPFVCDPAYAGPHAPRARAWIRLEHNFALITDHFLSEGITDGRRTHLVAEIVKNDERRRGIITYVSDEEGRYYHRYFSLATPNEIIRGYAKDGFKNLDFPPLEKGAEDDAGAVADDGSYVARTTPCCIEIADPKNDATLSICRFH